MRKAIDNYAQGKQREVEAWIGSSISASSGRFVCPECLESVALDIRGHFRHKNRTAQSLECDKRVDAPSRSAYERMGLPLYLCQDGDNKFSLGIGFSGHDEASLDDAEREHPKGPRPSVYRIADYEDGEFFPVDPQLFTDDKFEFSPKYLRTRPGDELPLYVPTLKEWKGIAKYEDSERMTTESFPYPLGDILEIVLIPSVIDPDPIVLQNKLHAGFTLPEGLRDTFLLVLDQDETTYTVAKCRKNMLKQSGNLFFFDDNISDMLHATHYLKTFVIEREDVFDTSRYGKILKPGSMLQRAINFFLSLMRHICTAAHLVEKLRF